MSIDKWIQHHKGDEPLFGLDRSKGINRINRSVSTEPLMTIEELEAKLEIVTKHRDAWKKMLDETNRHVLDMAALVEPGLHRHPVTVLQATHAFILNLMNERDEAKKEAAESSKEMIMLFNDHSSIELEKQLRIEELTRERDKFQALAELGDGYRRERDEARAEVQRLTDERDELLVRVADQGAELRATREAYRDVYCHMCAPMWEEP
jgi:uncharacterized coiled-coil DUF342 family protein